jgi:threonine synthase
MHINPLVRRAICSATGREVDTHGWSRPLGLSPHSGKPIVLEYDLERARHELITVPEPRRGLLRYEPLLPVRDLPGGYAGDVGGTLTVRHDALSRELGLDLFVKSEGSNPSGSFKDRGLAIGVALGAACGASRFCLPTQGNAGMAAALFSARFGLEGALVYMPEGHQGSVYHRASQLFGATVRFVGTNIAEAGARMREDVRAELDRGDFVDLSTFFEPGRLEGKKTMGLEIWEFFGAAALPEWIVYPTGGGTGLVGIWKAFQELAEMGLIASAHHRLPRMVAVQSEQCPPVVRAFEHGLFAVEPVKSQGTIADGLDVPAAIMGHQILRVLRESRGAAIAVSERAISEAFAQYGRQGVSAGYESAAALAGVRALREAGTIAEGSRVLLLNTSGPFPALLRDRRA